jgi:hypothetical protein
MKLNFILNTFFVLIVLPFIIALLVSGTTEYSNIRRVEKTNINFNPNRIIKSTYDIKNNLYAVVYIEDNDTIGLDWIYPYELDSLINDLNK